MKLIKKILAFFSPLEMIVLLSALVISTFLIIPAFEQKGNPSSSEIDEQAMSLTPLLSSVYAYNTSGSRVRLFDTSFVVFYDKEASSSETDAVIATLNETLVYHHKLFDRHNDYFAVDPLVPSAPTASEKAELPRLHNLKYINDHKNETHEIAKPLYDLLVFGKQYSKLTTDNAFNMFIGDLYDFWAPRIDRNSDPKLDPLFDSSAAVELARLKTFVPLTSASIDATLVLSNQNDKYYARLNTFNGSDDFSISVGSIAKGLITDILKTTLIARGLTRGYINGGASSITLLQNDYDGKARKFYMASINNSAPHAYEFSRTGIYQFSTSGIYEGRRFTYDGREVIRSHIIDPRTGYPVQQSHQLVNVASSTLGGLELDFLTTALVVLPEAKGLAFLREYFNDHDVNIAYAGIDNAGLFVSHNDGYPGGNDAKMIVKGPYREIFLDLL